MSNLDDLKRAMSALPAKQSAADVSLKKKVAALRPQIHELHFEKKWTWSEIAAWLTEKGEPITESTLKLYYYKSAFGYRLAFFSQPSSDFRPRPLFFKVEFMYLRTQSGDLLL